MDTPISSPKGKHFEVIITGNEFVFGIVTNRCTHFIGAQLSLHGVTLNRSTAIGDDIDDIADQVTNSLARSDVVIVVAGLGPAIDDRSRDAISKALGLPLIYDETIARAIAPKLPRGQTLDEHQKRQACRFENSELIENPTGVVPGQWLRLENGKIIVMLPGPAPEFQPMFAHQVLPRLEREGLLNGKKHFVQVRTTGIEESTLEAILGAILAKQPLKLRLSYCAHDGITDCLIASADGKATRNQLFNAARECIPVLGDNFVCLGNEPLAAVVARLLRDRRERFAAVETSTCGMFSHAFANLPGVTKIFAGAAISDDPRILADRLEIPDEFFHQHGLVSSEVAAAIAIGASERLNTPYGLSIVGYDIEEINPRPGVIYIALSAPTGVSVKKLQYPLWQQSIKMWVVNSAIDWFRRELLKANRKAAKERPPRFPLN